MKERRHRTTVRTEAAPTPGFPSSTCPCSPGDKAPLFHPARPPETPVSAYKALTFNQKRNGNQLFIKYIPYNYFNQCQSKLSRAKKDVYYLFPTARIPNPSSAHCALFPSHAPTPLGWEPCLVLELTSLGSGPQGADGSSAPPPSGGWGKLLGLRLHFSSLIRRARGKFGSSCRRLCSHAACRKPQQPSGGRRPGKELENKDSTQRMKQGGRKEARL